MERIGVVRLRREVLAVALLGLFETAEAMEFDRIFQHVRQRVRKVGQRRGNGAGTA
jgi:hypothetical protein